MGWAHAGQQTRLVAVNHSCPLGKKKGEKSKREAMCIFKAGFCAHWGQGLPTPSLYPSSYLPSSLPPSQLFLSLREKNQFSSNLLLPPRSIPPLSPIQINRGSLSQCFVCRVPSLPWVVLGMLGACKTLGIDQHSLEFTLPKFLVSEFNLCLPRSRGM